MREKGRVLRVEDGYAVVRMVRSKACSACGVCSNLSPGSDEMEIRALNVAGARPGEVAEVEVRTRGVLLAAFMLYGLPIAAGVLGYVGGSLAGRPYGIGGALAAFGLAFPVIRAVDKRLEGRPGFTPEIVGVDRTPEY
ncbi:MAG: SoxR reducing system RseC family protein [Firmicutes bacterium]|jgi:sigma-E factor negative regulatory protein RseC|nr:SoxR reducing system RseC family protein [Bacillota bacterium]